MTQAADRQWELDALRGLMLVLMASTHFPTRLADPLGQPFGFVSAAEGFVLLSAYMCGRVYGAKAQREGDDAMRGAMLQRVLKIYLCQAALLLFAFTVIAAIGVLAHQDAVTNLLGLYLDRPVLALLGSLLLVYNPALLDILPIYVMLMLLSPVLLLHGRRHGWTAVLALSTVLWLAAQFGLGLALYEWVHARLSLPVTYQQMGAFEIFGWQFLWVMGLWMGATASDGGGQSAVPDRFPRWMVLGAALIAFICFAWRHLVGQTPFPASPSLAPLFDKWPLGPLRLINVFALLVLVLAFGPWLKRTLPRVSAIELLGQQSLPVFCAHLVVALTALAVFGPPDAQRPLWVDALILAVGYCVLYAVAKLCRNMDQRSAARRERRNNSRQSGRKGPRSPQLSASGAAQSPPSTAHSPLC